MAEVALVVLMGSGIVELNPEFWPAMWEFARLALQLIEFHGICRRSLDAGNSEFDWNGPDIDAEWEPLYGPRMARELISWAKKNLSLETTAGIVATFVFGTNANSVCMSLWAMMELIADPELYRAVREECLPVRSVDLLTGE
ncbi:uncharacterized protein BDW43DRAFT_311127 [Aspergillus alliaceus]|uniref:uncharacterized protein n=1 Tax=Petromyces alliaceus TaxID=209559 RepID=UPI0012A5FD12|nr:uncharacterized protein BDW43DRAFT_311127 [Aspergillus alliaceus]KAB8233411.1 hypothetical protein BDW43DRAFT_311127 [Aspergillus alliaceus]